MCQTILAHKRFGELQCRIVMAMELDSSHHHPFHLPFNCLLSCNSYLGHVWVQFPKEFKNENQAQNFQNCLRFASLIVTSTSCKTKQKLLTIKHNSSMKLKTTQHLLQINPMQNVNNLLLKKTTNLVITLFN
jgi:hypothetical protein